MFALYYHLQIQFQYTEMWSVSFCVRALWRFSIEFYYLLQLKFDAYFCVTLLKFEMCILTANVDHAWFNRCPNGLLLCVKISLINSALNRILLVQMKNLEFGVIIWQVSFLLILFWFNWPKWPNFILKIY